MDDPVRQGLARGIDAFNEQAFFEAHDILEDVWLDARGESRLFLQGLIQLAIGFYHLTCDNYAGADHLLTRGLSKLEAYAPSAYDVNVAPLLEQAGKTLEAVRQTRKGERPVSFWTFPKIETLSHAGRD